MSRSRKIVATFFVLLLPATSAAALSVCPQGMPDMGAPPSQMAMMDMTPTQLSFTASENNLCCQASPAEIVPVQVKLSAGGEVPVIAVTVKAAVRVLQSERPNASYDIQSASPPAQARLCVFLI